MTYRPSIRGAPDRLMRLGLDDVADGGRPATLTTQPTTTTILWDRIEG